MTEKQLYQLFSKNSGKRERSESSYLLSSSASRMCFYIDSNNDKDAFTENQNSSNLSSLSGNFRNNKTNTVIIIFIIFII